MYTLLNERVAPAKGIVAFPEFTYVKNGLSRNLETAVNYYRANPMAVDSSHLLVRLLQSISIPFGEDVIIYKDRVTDLALNLAMSLGMTSPIATGKTFDGVFYGKGSSEVLLAHIEDFDARLSVTRWQDLEPIRVLKHPRTDVAMLLPNGQSYSRESGLCVIAINIPMLACQYRQFCIQAALTKDTPLSVNQFVHMFALPNMLYSQLDIAIVNRLYALFRGWSIADAPATTPFALPNYQANLDPILNRVLQNAQRMVTHDFANLLRGIPLVTANSLWDLARLPQVLATRQVTWALILARLTMFELLVQINYISRNENNGVSLNVIRKALLELKSDQSMRGGLTAADYRLVQSELKSDIEAYL